MWFTISISSKLSHLTSSGGNAETSAEECRGRRASMEVQDGKLRRAAEAGKLNLVIETVHIKMWKFCFLVFSVFNNPCLVLPGLGEGQNAGG